MAILNKTTPLGALLPLVLAGPGLADSPPLRFDVEFARPGIEVPRSGRLFVVLGRTARPEPRRALGRVGRGEPPMLAVDVRGMKSGSVAVIDASARCFPVASLAAIPPGEYFAQAAFHSNPDLDLPNAPGDLFGPVEKIQLDPAKGGTVRLRLTEEVPAEIVPRETDLVKFVKLESRALSRFHGRPIFLRAGVILPRDFDREPDRKYPLRVHIGGYGSRYTEVLGRMREGSAFRKAWMADDAPRMVFLHLDGAGPLGDPYQVDSANHGPYGEAVTRELIPSVEAKFRGVGDGKSRVLDGGSTGGWVSLALQVFYPEDFAGCWSSCPDGVDFRSFQLVNIYQDKNAYTDANGAERPAAREPGGAVRYTMRHELGMENLLGLGDSWAMSGGQWGAWNATYGPKGADGRPVPLWDPKTGAIDRAVAEHWKKYDLRMILERDWATLGPKLRGKIHVWVGESDDYFLNEAVHRLDAFLSRAEPPYGGSIAYGPGEGHCWMGIDEAEMMEQMARATTPGRP